MYSSMIRKIMKKMVSGDSGINSLAMEGNRLDDSSIMPSVDKNLTPSEKADSILSQMTLDEKITMLGGRDNLAIRGLPRLNLPDVWCSDASAGARCFGRSTAFPVPVAMAATWNPAIVAECASAIAGECRAKGVSILLAPGVNIYRVPTNGRNFEYMGEDPFLASKICVAFIKACQARGVITTVKHYACNNSDYDRHRMDSVVDERTLHEIYLPAFRAAVEEAGTASVMTAYNPVNGIYAAENSYLLKNLLREKWKFSGFIISDWISVYNTERTIKYGVDVEMPAPKHLTAKKIKPLLKKGIISEKEIDFKIKNLLTVFFKMGVYERPLKDKTYSEYSPENSGLSLKAAREAVTLLKNQNSILPLNRSKIKKIAVLGENAAVTPTCGGGSCNVKSYDKINILDGLKKSAGPGILIEYLSLRKGSLNASAKRAVSEADAVIVCAGYNDLLESEFYDRDWELPNGQSKLINSVYALNKNLVLVVSAGGDFEKESWIDSAPALLLSYYLGQNAGQAIAEIIFGGVNPSGKLPFSMARRWDDLPSVHNYVKNPGKISLRRIIGPQAVPGIRKVWPQYYREGLMVGYRHFDMSSDEPAFPFGFGLSYTDFTLSDISLSADTIRTNEFLTISVRVRNSGKVPGSETVQLYIRDAESSLMRPFKELKGFQKVYLEPGRSALINFQISTRDLSFYDDAIHGWKSEPGEFTAFIGSSSSGTFLSRKFNLV